MSVSRSSTDASRSGLLLPRFSLRTLLVTMTALSLVFAVMSAVGFVWSMAMVLIGCLAGAHVLGNSLGTKLRDESTRASASDRPPIVPADVAVRMSATPPPRLPVRPAC